jgi:hypothetical protein
VAGLQPAGGSRGPPHEPVTADSKRSNCDCRITAAFPLSPSRFGIRFAAVVPRSLVFEPCRQPPQH